MSGIIGSGWLFAPLLTSRLAGPAAIFSWIIGGVAMLILALCFAEVMGLVVEGSLEPVVDVVWPLERAREAHERLEAGEAFGKIVLTP